MKLKLKTLTDKVTVAIAYILTVAIAVCLALAINFMYDYRFYSPDYQVYPTQKAMSMKTEGEYEFIKEYVIYSQMSQMGLSLEDNSVYRSLEQRYDPANSNIVFVVTDGQGHVLLQNDENYNGKDYYFRQTKPFTVISQNGKTVSGSISVYVRSDMNKMDDFKLTVMLIHFATAVRYVIFAVLFVLICVAVFLLGLLMFSVEGAGDEKKGKRRLYLDRIPFDVLTLMVFLLLAVAIVLVLLTSVAGIKETNIVLWNAVILLVEFFISVILLFYCLSIASRAKSGKVFQNTLVYKVYARIRNKRGKPLGKGVKIPFIAKGLIIIGSAMLADLAAIFYFVYQYKTCETGMLEDFNFLFFAFLQLAIVVILGATFFLIIFNLNAIRESGKRIANRDFEQVADSHIMFGDFKAINDDLIAIKDEMINALEEKNKSQELRNELIANVSHDIKTPLTSIINYADIIGSGKCTQEDIESYTDIIKTQSERLKDLLRSLIDVSRISAGAIKVEPTETDINLFVAQTLEEFAFRFEETKLRIETAYPDTDVTIMADSTMLWRVFENLFGNICKYAMPETRVFVDVKREDGKVYVSIKNISRTPITVPTEELLIRFKQNDSSRHTEGHGLGLSIAQSFTELQGGTFEVIVDGDVFKTVMTFDEVEEEPLF